MMMSHHEGHAAEPLFEDTPIRYVFGHAFFSLAFAPRLWQTNCSEALVVLFLHEIAKSEQQAIAMTGKIQKLEK